ncbi:MAG: Melibiose carrier protein [Tenericutes bacterium ADurb.BinA155]|nr:MAG: Melibiose carrier protein [Tenericutes bacterium ADurb.BinA155]
MDQNNAGKSKRGFHFFDYYSGDKIPPLTKWIYSIASIFRDASYALVSAFMLNYMMYSGVLSSDKSEYGAQIAVINIILIICLIWDGLNDPIMGFIVERVHFKLGKYRPWILIGGIGNTIVILCLFLIRPSGWAYVVCWAIFYFLWDLVFTINDIAYWAMLPSLTSDEKARANITTVMSIFISIGTFGMYAACSLLPSTVGYQIFYSAIAILSATLFLISQLAIFFLCKEHVRDPKQEAISEKSKFKDMFTLIKKNKPLRYSVLAILLYYTGSTILVGFGINYFYMAYGFGGSFYDASGNFVTAMGGGGIQTIVTVMYVFGTLIAQFLFPLIKKKFSLQKIMTWSMIITVVGYVMFFLVGFPLFGNHPFAWNDSISAEHGFVTIGDCLGGRMFLLYIPAVIFFAAEGVMDLVILLMMQNSIEYNEYTFGERKESVAFSWRPLTAKFASAIQKGLVYLTLFISLIFPVTSAISGYQNDLAAVQNANRDNLNGTEVREALTEATANINKALAGLEPWQVVVIGIGMVGSALICVIGAWALVHFGYKLDEKEYDRICGELKKRHEADIKEVAAKEAAAKAN